MCSTSIINGFQLIKQVASLNLSPRCRGVMYCYARLLILKALRRDNVGKSSYNINYKFIFILFILFLAVFIIIFNKRYNITEVFAPTKELPIYSVEREDNKVSISFDAAWGDEFTYDILDTLDEYDVKATFFLVGFWVEKYPEHVKEIYKRGHEIGNHSTTHPNMSTLSREQMAKEILVTEEKIMELINKKPILFRPPFGDYNDNLIQVLRENGYYTIQWDIDSLDWKELGVQPVVDKVTRNIGNGSIVLFHNNAKYISEYLPLVLDRLKASNYEIVPISELIYLEDFQMNNSGRQIKMKK